MKVYIPQVITTRAQAEALPVVSVVINDEGDRYNYIPGLPGRSGRWHSAEADRDLYEDLDLTIFTVEITAFVPVEAEEETRDHPGIMLPTCPPKHPQQTRLVTEWKDVS